MRCRLGLLCLLRLRCRLGLQMRLHCRLGPQVRRKLLPLLLQLLLLPLLPGRQVWILRRSVLSRCCRLLHRQSCCWADTNAGWNKRVWCRRCSWLRCLLPRCRLRTVGVACCGHRVRHCCCCRLRCCLLCERRRHAMASPRCVGHLL